MVAILHNIEMKTLAQQKEHLIDASKYVAVRFQQCFDATRILDAYKMERDHIKAFKNAQSHAMPHKYFVTKMENQPHLLKINKETRMD